MGSIHFQMIYAIPGTNFDYTQVIHFDNIEQKVRSMAEFVKFYCPREPMDSALEKNALSMMFFFF